MTEKRDPAFDAGCQGFRIPFVNLMTRNNWCGCCFFGGIRAFCAFAAPGPLGEVCSLYTAAVPEKRCEKEKIPLDREGGVCYYSSRSQELLMGNGVTAAPTTLTRIV